VLFFKRGPEHRDVKPKFMSGQRVWAVIEVEDLAGIATRLPHLHEMTEVNGVRFIRIY
jgi:hypothetical protein